MDAETLTATAGVAEVATTTVNRLAGAPGDAPCYNAGDTAWVLLSTILVLGMMPALAFFEAGLLRARNTLSIITQILVGLSANALLWYICGFSLVFGESNGGVIGGFDWSFYLNLHELQCLKGQTIPALTYALFQCMFASITPLLITGSIAERMRFPFFIYLVVLWEIIVYYPLAHWIWNPDGWLAKLGTLDFAGGIVIHTSAGVASLILALLLGHRAGFSSHKGEVAPHNVPLAATGAALLWMGWYGFNAGSALSSGGLSTVAVANTTVASAIGTLVWSFLSVVHHKHVSTLAVLNGAIAGLAGITPASGFITPSWACLVSIFIAVGGFYGIYLLKHKLHIDDALDVSSVHGITGIIGSIAIGFFADDSINPNGHDGWIHGNPKQLGWQILGVVVAASWAGFWTLVLVGPVRILRHYKNSWYYIIFKISKADQDLGLDFIEHGRVRAYHMLERDTDIGGSLLVQDGHAHPETTGDYM